MEVEMVAVKIEQSCVENRQSAAASTSSVSEGSSGFGLKSPGVCSPAPTVSSPSHHRLAERVTVNSLCNCGYLLYLEQSLPLLFLSLFCTVLMY
ncbi:hypothetical protein ACLOJK_002613 [Asimina triloba]